ncbi:MAG TPA: hypothetical protein VGN23_07140 [Verrucomicrobiae bacterium]|jgi:hypothetical protein
MQSLERMIQSKRPGPPEISCPLLPSFETTNLENVRKAFYPAMPCSLRQDWLDKEEVEFLPATVCVGWRENSLLIFAEIADTNIFNRATKLNQCVWELGDAFEIFLCSEGNENYVEIHITPNNQRLQLHYPDSNAVKTARGSGGWAKFMIWGDVLHSKTWIGDGKWHVYAEIPAAFICRTNGSIENTQWRFSFGRYDYVHGVKKPVLSSTSPHAEPDFHRQHEWGKMTCKNFL